MSAVTGSKGAIPLTVNRRPNRSQIVNRRPNRSQINSSHREQEAKSKQTQTQGGAIPLISWKYRSRRRRRKNQKGGANSFRSARSTSHRSATASVESIALCKPMENGSHSGKSRFIRVEVMTASLGFLRDFNDVYRLWAFVAKFLNLAFIEEKDNGLDLLVSQRVQSTTLSQ